MPFTLFTLKSGQECFHSAFEEPEAHISKLNLLEGHGDVSLSQAEEVGCIRCLRKSK